MDLINPYDLSKVLEAEIASKQLCLEKTMPGDFPFAVQPSMEYPFDRNHELKLTREFGGERIRVKVSVPYSHDSGRGKKSGAYAFSLKVKIAKRNGKTLSIKVSASADDITVESISVKVPFDDDDEDRFVPEDYMVDKDSSLQRALRQYLKTRGIKKPTIDFLYKYMDWTSNNQPLIVLKNLHLFINT